MTEKQILSRIIQKHDIETNWNKATNFVPMRGELIVYDIDANYDYERLKIGDGTTSVVDLPFTGGVDATARGLIGDLTTLRTEAQTDLVSAVNELVASVVTIDATLTQSGQAADAKAVGDAINSLSEEIVNLQTSGLTTAQVKALDGMFKVCAFTKDNVSAEYTAFKTAFGIADSGDGGETEVTLTSISATYSGGSVTAGTAVNDLTGIVVTAHYSDGTSESVTGYTLSGTISEGSNTITVSYGGKTTTFTIVGVSIETGVSNETEWTNGVDYTFTPIMNEYPDRNSGEIKAYDGWVRTPYLYCEGASILRITALVNTSSLNNGNQDNCFYDADKNYVSGFSFNGTIGSSEPGTYTEISIPDNVAYVVVSGTKSNLTVPHIKLTPYE